MKQGSRTNINSGYHTQPPYTIDNVGRLFWRSVPRQRSSSDGQWRYMFHPISIESRDRLNEAVLKAYEKFIEEGEEKIGINIGYTKV